jgi:hypothetical protein
MSSPRDVAAKKLKTADTLYCSLVDVDWVMFLPLLPEFNNQLLCFADVKGEVDVLVYRNISWS